MPVVVLARTRLLPCHPRLMAVSALGLMARSTSTFTKAGAGGVEGALDGTILNACPQPPDVCALLGFRPPLSVLFVGGEFVQCEWTPLLFGLKPLLERPVAFARLSPCEQALYADVLVEVGPVNPLPAANQLPVVTLLRRRVTRRGCQANGTEMVLPSDNSAVSVSSVTATFLASGTLTSVVETYETVLPQKRRRA